MRSVFLGLMLCAGVAYADGGYFTESLGGAGFGGDLARFPGAPRLAFGGGYVHGPWALEFTVAGLIPDLFFIDCYGEECASALAPQAGMTEVNLDVRKAWRVIYSKWTNKIGLDLVLHAGPRFVTGEEAIGGYDGAGLGGGAAIDLNLKLLSMFVDFSSDWLVLTSPERTLTGRVDSVSMGMRLGWM